MGESASGTPLATEAWNFEGRQALTAGTLICARHFIKQALAGWW